MAKFYGTLQGARGEATRLGHTGITASAQSWHGSIIVHLSEQDGETVFEIRIAPGSAAYGGRILAEGKLSDLLNAQALLLSPQPDGRTPETLCWQM